MLCKFSYTPRWLLWSERINSLKSSILISMPTCECQSMPTPPCLLPAGTVCMFTLYNEAACESVELWVKELLKKQGKNGWVLPYTACSPWVGWISLHSSIPSLSVVCGILQGLAALLQNSIGLDKHSAECFVIPHNLCQIFSANVQDSIMAGNQQMLDVHAKALHYFYLQVKKFKNCSLDNITITE